MVERIERRLADAPDQIAERRIAVQAGAQHQRVDEEADERLELLAGSIRDRHGDRDVVLARVAGDERLDGGGQRHEQRAFGGRRERPQARGDLVRHREVQPLAAVGRPGGPRPVGRQLQVGASPLELRVPVGALTLAHLALQPPALPVGDVGVLHRQRRQRGWLACEGARVQRAELVLEDAERPAVPAM